jgi:glycosyltransferase involved in cell wall biosynthesis
MRILLLAYYFPPSPEVGGLRARKIAESLRDRGHEVFVIAGPITGQIGGAEIQGLNVQRVRSSLSLREVYFKLKGQRNGTVAVGGGASVGTPWKPPDRTPFLKRQISSALWLPDDRQGWILPAARAGARLVRKHGIDVLISTAPPQSVQLAALLVRARTGVPWIAEFRDPWTDNPSKPAFVRSDWSDAAERWLERLAFRRAHAIITVTDAYARIVKSRLPADLATKVNVVRNGIDVLDPPVPLAHGVRTIVYVGSLYADRDPRPFFRSIARLRKRDLLPDPLRIELIGDCRWLMGESMEAAVRDLGLADLVHFVDPLPHDECMRRIRQADLLLLIAQGQPLQVPNKLYEYLGVRRPILAFVDEHGETAAMLREVGGHAIIRPNETDEAVDDAVLAALSRAGPTATAGAEAQLVQWTSAAQFERLTEILESIAA